MVMYFMIDINKDCEVCKVKYCSPDCFNNHQGSVIALGKLLSEIEHKKGIRTHLVTE